MKTQIIIADTLDGIAITGPFSLSNNAIYRMRGGEFDQKSKRWIFDRADSILAMITELVGDESPLVEVRVPRGLITEHSNQWQLGGYLLATRYEWDHPVKFPVGSRLEKGCWLPEGGTAGKPLVTATDDFAIVAVVRASFAETHKLEVIARDDAPCNPLAAYSNADLVAELERRGSSL